LVRPVALKKDINFNILDAIVGGADTVGPSSREITAVTRFTLFRLKLIRKIARIGWQIRFIWPILILYKSPIKEEISK